MPTFDRCNDLVWICPPDEGLWFLVMLFDEALMIARRSTTDWKTPYFGRRRVRFVKKPSMALSHEQDVGTKWNVQRGSLASQARTFGCLWVA